jgi:hypothetical protein
MTTCRQILCIALVTAAIIYIKESGQLPSFLVFVLFVLTCIPQDLREDFLRRVRIRG